MNLPSNPLQYFDRQGRLQTIIGSGAEAPQPETISSALASIAVEYHKLTCLALEGVPPENLVAQASALHGAAGRLQVACHLEMRSRDELLSPTLRRSVRSRPTIDDIL